MYFIVNKCKIFIPHEITVILFKHWLYSQMLYFYRTYWDKLDLIENMLGHI